MAKSSEYVSHDPKNPPAWYWTKGLHDAAIIGVEAFEFPFDYNKFVEEKSQYNRNLLVLKINASGTLYDTAIKEIRLYNYKILTPDVSLENRNAIWWLADQLNEQNGCYVLKIRLQDLDSYPEDYVFTIRFDRAEVKRK